MIKRLAPLVSLVLVLACGTPTGTVEEFVLGEPFWIDVGATKVSTDGGTAVRFTKVVTDSRCQTDVVCVWAGEAIIEVEVWNPIAAASVAPPSYEVKIGAPEQVAAGDRRIEAMALDPLGDGGRPPNRRRARLRISLLPAP